MKKILHNTLDDRGRLHCDNPDCRYVLPDALPWGPQLIGYPCPRCGADMLTRQDFERSEQFTRWINWLNKWFGWLGSKEPPRKGSSLSVRHTPDGVDLKLRKDR